LWIFGVILVVGAAADLVTKSMVFSRFQIEIRRVGEQLLAVAPGPLEGGVLIPGCFSIRPSINTGAVFGVFAGQVGWLGVLSALAILAILIILIRTEDRSVLFLVAMGLVSAGAVGNLWDRLMLGGVRDFLDFYVWDMHWPTFNLADSWICIGVGILVLLEILQWSAKSGCGEDEPESLSSPEKVPKS
jgi:signal peptidase II